MARAVVDDLRAERAALDRVRRSGAEVVRRVAAERGRRVGGRDLDDAGGGELVDDVERDARRLGADRDRHLRVDQLRRCGARDGEVVAVAGVGRGVDGDVLAEHAAGGVDVLDGEADAGLGGRGQVGERARVRQDGADAEGVLAGAAGRLAVGRGVGLGRRRRGRRGVVGRRKRWWNRLRAERRRLLRAPGPSALWWIGSSVVPFMKRVQPDRH